MMKKTFIESEVNNRIGLLEMQITKLKQKKSISEKRTKEIEQRFDYFFGLVQKCFEKIKEQTLNHFQINDNCIGIKLKQIEDQLVLFRQTTDYLQKLNQSDVLKFQALKSNFFKLITCVSMIPLEPSIANDNQLACAQFQLTNDQEINAADSLLVVNGIADVFSKVFNITLKIDSFD